MLAFILFILAQRLKDVRCYLVSEDEFLFPALPLDEVKPAC